MSWLDSILATEAKASTALDGETHSLPGTVNVGDKKSDSELVAEFEEWNQKQNDRFTTAYDLGYLDATHDLVRDLQEMAEESNEVKSSRIRVQLSRPLTWAEKEDLETDPTDEHLRRNDLFEDNDFVINVEKNGKGEFTYVWVDAYMGSRVAYELIAALLEHSYVNVFPRAVRTDREYNG